MTTTAFVWFTDGSKNTRLPEGAAAPSGFVRGRTHSQAWLDSMNKVSKKLAVANAANNARRNKARSGKLRAELTEAIQYYTDNSSECSIQEVATRFGVSNSLLRKELAARGLTETGARLRRGTAALSFESQLSEQGMQSLTNNEAAAERSLRPLFEEHDAAVEFNKRTLGIDLDIYSPKHKLAVEYNGTYWHSDRFKHKNHHLNKTKVCEAAGVKLIHVFEWQNLDLIIAKLRVSMGQFEKIYARATEIVEVSSAEFRDFCNSNHIQGGVNCSNRLGLRHNSTGRLVAVLGLSKSRFDKSFDYELVRYCALRGVAVVGGFTKILAHFERVVDPGASIISYANRAYSNGNLYEQAGFERIRETPPSYVWAKGTSVLTRYQTQTHKLGSPEVNHMTSRGFSRVYDCGTLVFARGASHVSRKAA
ncbi:MAG: hypothetical protein DDT26_00750 [Dehalococcoidia bacterium]|nr:hypothetical protein [Chloroflexota bacterium]